MPGDVGDLLRKATTAAKNQAAAQKAAQDTAAQVAASKQAAAPATPADQGGTSG